MKFTIADRFLKLLIRNCTNCVQFVDIQIFFDVSVDVEIKDGRITTIRQIHTSLPNNTRIDLTVLAVAASSPIPANNPQNLSGEDGTYLQPVSSPNWRNVFFFGKKKVERSWRIYWRIFRSLDDIGYRNITWIFASLIHSVNFEKFMDALYSNIQVHVGSIKCVIHSVSNVSWILLDSKFLL